MAAMNRAPVLLSALVLLVFGAPVACEGGAPSPKPFVPSAPSPGGGVHPAVTPGAAKVGGWASIPQPADANGSSRQVIGAWNMVPWQTFDGRAQLAAVAFQAPTKAEYAAGVRNAIAKVSFACAGGPWTDVAAPVAYNGHQQYVAEVDTAALPDGEFECRFIAYPTTGRALVAQGTTIGYKAPISSILLFANHKRSLHTALRYADARGGSDGPGCGASAKTACQTLAGARDELSKAMGGDVGGGVVCAMPGSYKWGRDDESPNLPARRWMTVRPCDRVARDQVVIDSLGLRTVARGLGPQKVHVQGVTTRVRLAGNDGRILDVGQDRGGSNNQPVAYIWTEDVKTVGNRSNADSQVSGDRWLGAYLTRPEITGTGNAALYATLIQDGVFHGLTNDVMNNARTVIGAKIYNLRQDNCDKATNPRCPFLSNHSDLYQINGDVRNIVLYDIEAHADFLGYQWLLTNNFSATDMAFVNVKGGNSPRENRKNHLWNLNGPGSGTNIFVLNSAWEGHFHVPDWPFVDSTWVDTKCMGSWGPTAAARSGLIFLGSNSCNR